MSYSNDEFWDLYAAWSAETIGVHRELLRGDDGDDWFDNRAVLDLGSGKVELFKALVRGQVGHYMPTDLIKHNPSTVTLDHGDIDRVGQAVATLEPDTIVSMFSVDVVHPIAYANRVWRMCLAHPFVDNIISSGFYYDDARRSEEGPIIEAGGLVSYQVPRGQHLNDGFVEHRIERRVPSKLFGPDVVEVWRFMRRSS